MEEEEQRKKVEMKWGKKKFCHKANKKIKNKYALRAKTIPLMKCDLRLFGRICLDDELNWTELCISHNYQAVTKACVHVYHWAYRIGAKGLISAETDIDWPTRPVDQCQVLVNGNCKLVESMDMPSIVSRIYCLSYKVK